MDIKNISQKIATFVENLLTEEFEKVYAEKVSEDYLQTINEEQEAFEQGVIENDEPIVEMDEESINQQTMEFLKLHGKKQA